MPTIAQKLCHDIVDLEIKPSADTVKNRSSGKIPINSSNRLNTKTPYAGYMSKSKISKTERPHTSGSSIKGEKSGVTVLKKNIADSAVNTLVSGPLRCDNNCVTSLRKRNHQGICKCGQNRKSKVCTREIQTLNKAYYSLSDKACTQCVETVSCGTQFFDNKGNMLKRVGILNRKSKTPIKLTDFEEEYFNDEQDFNKYKCFKNDSNRNQFGRTMSKPGLRYVSAKRWALTNYPTKGPDF